MKKTLLTSLFIAIISFASFAQRNFEETFDVSTISGADTTLYFSWYSAQAWVLQYDYNTLDADDAVIDFGHSQDKSGIVLFVNDSLPYTMNTSYRTLNAIYSRQGHSSEYVAIKITKNSVTSGSITFKGRNK